MSTGSPKTKPNDRPTPVRTTVRTTASVREVGIRDITYRQWVRRIVANLFPEKAERSPECSDAESNTALTTGEQIYVQLKLERLDHGYGFYQQPLRHRADIDSLDQLFGPAAKEAKNAKGVKRD